MTHAQKILIQKLVAGHFLRKMSRRGKEWYVLYDARVNPVMKIFSKTVDNLDRFMDPKKKLWKKNRHGDISLNLSSVRQLHGKNTIKRLYKGKDAVDTGANIYKPKRKRSATKKQDEKVNYLF